ncbi:PF20097 family protein [Oscillibacter sp.]|uniref:PF20097 family protein n=1 Tax=Oscillibacter sp. TaxID=1945593 RepID=UPI00339B8823
MAFWNQDDEGEWEKYQKSKEKESQEPEEKKTPSVSEEFHEYFKTARQAQSPESGEAEQPGEKASPFQTFLSRFRGDEKPEEPEGPPEKCPWCGGDMVKGYLQGGRDSVYWRPDMPKFLTIPSVSVSMLNEGKLYSYKTVWHCEKCHKMVLDTLLLDPPLGNATISDALLNSMSTEDRAAYEPDAAADTPAGEPEAHNQET